MGHKFIRDINSGEYIDEVYLVTDPILRSTTNGDLYVAMYISDRTGRLNGRMWQATEAAYEKLPKPGFVRIQGRSELYKNNLQIVVNQFGVVNESQVNLEDFLARTKKDTNKMFTELVQILSKVKHAQLRKLIDVFLADKKLMDKFCKAPAAAKLHHDCLGGLLEHTHNMLRAAVQILPLYPQLQADLVLTGIFLHDIGKTEELTYDIAFSYTDMGQLLGHITKGVLILQKKADELAAGGVAVDEQILDVLGHIILSHHGEYEFGSPKLPAIAEAFVVNYLDNLDAKLYQVEKAIEEEPGDGNWTNWQSALGTRLYRKPIE